MSQNHKLQAGLSLDLDNKWAYLKSRDDSRWEGYPSYFDVLIPELLELLQSMQLKITWFIVGKDACVDRNQDYLQQVAECGHDVGNHSFLHDPWLQGYSQDRLYDDILRSEEAIQELMGDKLLGFRGPGFTWSANLILLLAQRGYLYDASTLPTYIGPIARRYYFRVSNIGKEEKEKRKSMYGEMKNGLQSNKPYFWETESGTKLLELPVTTIPGLKIPFHMSYLLYLSRYSEKLMLLYLKFALSQCKLANVPVSFLLHPLDFLDKEQAPELAFFPAMEISRENKIERFKQVIKLIKKDFEVVSLNELAEAMSLRTDLKVIRQAV